MTPMQKQFNDIKSEYKDALLLFRMGDFYEIFDEDAAVAAKILGITLTSRGKGENKRPMAGIPYHALNNYLPKLVEAGVKVAIAEQTTQPTPGKQIVEREVVKVITPGTILDENSLKSEENNFILSLYYCSDQVYYASFTDITTGKLFIFETESLTILENEISKLNPAEILIYEEQAEILNQVTTKKFVQKVDSSYFLASASFDILTNHFNTTNLKGFGLDEQDSALIPAGALLRHLEECQKGELKHITSLQKYSFDLYMQLDPSTIANLELLYPLTSNDSKATLFGILNSCKTGMGQRLLRSFILRPLLDKEIIEDRYDAVEHFVEEPILNGTIRGMLSECYDIERLTSRIGTGSVTPKDLRALELSVDRIVAIKQELQESAIPTRLKHLVSNIEEDQLQNLVIYINKSIAENPPVASSDLGVIADGFDTEIDELRSMRSNIHGILDDMKKREIEQTGISTLKISFNKVFGYYIEITRAQSDKAPNHYIRKQTLANAERFITEELKELEEKILSSEDRLHIREKELYLEIVLRIQDDIELLNRVADSVAELDVLSNLGFVAYQKDFTRAEIQEDSSIEIRDGRHPVVEEILQTDFVPNHSKFTESEYIHLLTGPNMSGKSTYIRQVALITLMAQMGSFVPASKMSFSIKDRIFTRVGASDNLAKGESTFMVEMIETANILNNATKDSLVILDEVGRGTSTYDGVAIAWSIVEHIAEKLHSSTLFATHYHELITLEEKYKQIKNYNVAVDDESESIKFLHKIIEGGTNRSYGIHVAKLAGVPIEVTSRAEDILRTLENSDIKPKKKKSDTKISVNKKK